MITDWLMVGITFVYVVATGLICYANFNSAKASKAQLDEMRRQYDESNRARIEVEFVYLKRSFVALRFVNHGRCVADDVRIIFDSSFIDSIAEPKIASLVKRQMDKRCIIGVDQHYDLFIGTNKFFHNENRAPVTGIVKFKSNGIEYERKIFVDLDSYMTFFSVESEQEDLVKAVNKETAVLEKMSEIIQGKRYFYGDYEDDIDV